MKTTLVSDLGEMEDGELIMMLRGTINKAYDQKTGENDNGEWTVQNCMFSDDSEEEVRITVWNHPDLKKKIGDEITIQSVKGKKGFTGINVHDNTYKGKTTREITVGSQAKISVAGDDGAEEEAAHHGLERGERPAKREHKHVDRGEPEETNARPEVENDFKAFRKRLMQMANAWFKIKEAIGIENTQSNVNGIETTQEQFQGQCSTTFIQLAIAGLIETMPTKPLWSIEMQPMSKKAPKKNVEESTEEEPF